MKNPPCWESTTAAIVVYRPSWHKTFFRSDAKMQKDAEAHRPVESAAAVEIGFGGLWQLFLDDFHKLLGKHKTLSTLTTRSGHGYSIETLKCGRLKTRLLDLSMKE